MSENRDWNARRILSELCDTSLRREILSAFWKKGELPARYAAASQLARKMNFREETIRKAPVERKADWLYARAAAPELEESLEMGLMIHHTAHRVELLSAFLDRWNIPHQEGTIEADDYQPPTEEAVRAAAIALEERFGRREVAVYLATAGLLMSGPGGGWRLATWPVVDELSEGLSQVS